MLGVIIGITAVIVIMSVGAGAQSLIINQLEGQGANLIGVLPGAADDAGPPASAMGILVTTLKYDDYRELLNKARAPHIVAAAPYSRGVGSVVWQNRSIDGTFVGSGYQYLDVEGIDLAAGRFLTEEEERSLARVAILGPGVVEDLFVEADPIGEKIKINKENFTVIGTMKQKDVSGLDDPSDVIVIPVSSAQKLLLGIDHLGFARAKVDSPENVESSMEDVRSILREQHDIDEPADDDFSVRSIADAIKTLTSITDALKYFLTAIAAIALFVGGVGIMNIMLAAVTERTREIGLRKAVGATRENILSQFLVEAVMLTFSAGVIGIVIGALIAFLIASVAQYLGYSWDFVVSLDSILIACVVCIGIGVTFGYYPARRAAGLNPIEALRYE